MTGGVCVHISFHKRMEDNQESERVQFLNGVLCDYPTQISQEQLIRYGFREDVNMFCFRIARPIFSGI